MSLAENIAISNTKETPDTEKELHLLEEAGIKWEKLPHGLETMLSREFGGIDLSGGEWQKVAISRGAYRKGRFIILDEPTASIDPLEETRLYQTLKQLGEGCTSFLVTHRLEAH